MRAVAAFGALPVSDPKSFIEVDLPTPTLRPRDLLVEVRAISVNPVDYKVRSSAPADPSVPRVLGWDVAGVVRETGPEVQWFGPGDEVYYAGDITRPGCYSELHVVDERIVGTKPQSLSFAQAAAMPLTTLTAWELLVDRFGLSMEQRHEGILLVIAGAGGVGSIAIQIGRALGLNVVATASRPETIAWCRSLGAQHVIDHRQELAPQLRGAGLDAVEYIGCFSDYGAYFDQFAGLLRPQGKLGLIVSHPKPVNLTTLMQKSITISWELMFTRAMFGTPDLHRQREILDAAAKLFDAGTLRSTLHDTIGTINATNLRTAHAQLESGATIGKLVLEGF